MNSHALGRLFAWLRGPLVVGFVIFFALGTAVFYARRGSSGGQPIAFNHAKHVQGGMACTDCHTGAQAQQRATLPGVAVCLVCHESAVTQSTEEAKIRAVAAAQKELVWTQVTQVPAHVYFSHRRHVQVARLECNVCHGPMEKATAPPHRPYRAITMDTCIECHQRNRAGTDCDDCHH